MSPPATAAASVRLPWTPNKWSITRKRRRGFLLATVVGEMSSLASPNLASATCFCLRFAEPESLWSLVSSEPAASALRPGAAAAELKYTMRSFTKDKPLINEASEAETNETWSSTEVTNIKHQLRSLQPQTRTEFGHECDKNLNVYAVLDQPEMNVAISYNPKTKRVEIPDDVGAIVPQLKAEVDQLNTLTADLISLGAEVPPVADANNFNKDLSKMIKKLYEGGVAAFRQGKFETAVKQFNIGIEMIVRRHKFESFQGTIQELSMFLMSRTDANLKVKDYMAAFNDADLLLNLQMNTADNFLRRGVCNYFLGNYEDARADYQRGLAFSPNHPRLIEELEICLDKILEENGDFID